MKTGRPKTPPKPNLKVPAKKMQTPPTAPPGTPPMGYKKGGKVKK
jgi:hypothetical protein